MTARTPLIVGAGPTGLAAALFLHERGFGARVVDAAAQPAPWSKALGVNPRTLDLLEPSGVTARIQAEGMAVQGVRVTQDGRPIATIALDYAAIGAQHPLTILPQARTEELLVEALARRGVQVERGVRCIDVRQDETAANADLVGPDGLAELVHTPLLLAADGSHSAVRKALGVGFPGDSLDDAWTLADVELDGPAPGFIHVDLRRDGVLVAFPFSQHRWRFIAIGTDVLSRLPKDWSAGTVFWRSEFHISHRIADRLSIGRIALAGDAAHIHSPIGARGMNLGIEDAWVWAACAADALQGRPERMDHYGKLRLKVDAGVVRKIRRITNAVVARGPIASSMRRFLPPLIARTPALRNVLLRQVAGLDHALRSA